MRILTAAALACTLLAQDGARPPLPADTLRPEELAGVAPLGLGDAIPGLVAGPQGEALAALGRTLFFDPVLSIDRTVSCASCHEPEHAFASPAPRPLGIQGRRCDRNSPTVLNRAFGGSHFWDGRAATLEQQVLMPIENENEMGLAVDAAVARLAADPAWRARFAAAGAAEPDRATLAAALAEFLRRLVTGDTPVDRFRAAKGDLTPLERRGLWLFESKGRCWRCHAGPNFSDEDFHNTGVGVRDGVAEEARAKVTGLPADRGRFKTPTLRMVARTAPYMHDGSLATLADVIRYYQRGGNANAHLDERLQPLELTEDDVAALVAFLEALSRPAEPPPSAR